MEDLFSQMAADTAVAPQQEDLSKIAALADQQRTLEDRVKKGEEYLKQLKEELRNVQEVQLPDAMLQCGVREFKLENGLKISIKKFYQGKITDDHRDEAFGWLKQNGHDDIIKNIVNMQFGKGEDSKASAVLELLQANGYVAVNEKSVHPMTLKAFIREMVESGADLPLETFGVYIGNKAEIK
jgi:hypothetical protein